MSIFDRLDNYYSSRKPSEVWLMVVLVAVLIGYLLYTLLSPMAFSYEERQESINSELKDKISSHESFLRTITVNGDRDYYIKDLNKKIAQKTIELNNYRAKLTKLSQAMNDLSDILYTKDNWSKFLHNIASKAKDNDLKIYNINNKVLDQNATFGKVLDINIKCQGEYGKVLSFMNDLENTKLVTNITSVSLSATKSEPIADINMSVWGVKP
jgi:Tfp pilus assembly protein PilO